MRPGRTVAFHTLGCKLNFAETSTLARSLEEAGFARVRPDDRPDVFVLNTCSVTDNADKECRQWVRRFRRLRPDAFVVVVGCYAQLKPEAIAAMPGVDLVLGAQEKFDLAGHLDSFSGRPEQGVVMAGPIKEVRRFEPSWSTGDRTRAFLKVQDGCDYFCSFCTIPLARGRSRSATVAETVAMARRIAARGVREVVLTGVNTGDFGRAHGENLLRLAEHLDRVDGIDRIRISSIEPDLCHDELIAFVAESLRFMPHFHMPLQSGSDVVLARMRRRYDTTLYAARVQRIRRAMPHACIGADVITGTPGETEEEFQRTHAFIREAGLDHLHVFTYSERADTTAIRMAARVPMELRRERTRQLRGLGAKLHRAHLERHLGGTRPVLFERGDPDTREALMEGYTDNYIRVAMPYQASNIDRIVPVKLVSIAAEGHMNGAMERYQHEPQPVG